MARKSIYLPGDAANDSSQHHLVPDAAVRGDFLFTSGIIGCDRSGQMPATNELQAARIYERILEILDTAGFSAEEVGHFFIWALERHPAVGGKVRFMNPYWEKLFPNIKSRPARHAIGRPLDPRIHYKVGIVAVKNARRTSFEINDTVFHQGGTDISGYIPFGTTMGRYLYSGPTYGMDPTNRDRRMGSTAKEQARLCQLCNEELYRMSGHTPDDVAQMYVWYHDAEGKNAAVAQTEAMFPNKGDRPAIHYAWSHLPFWPEVNSQFLIQYDLIAVAGMRRRILNVHGVSVLDGEDGAVPAGVAMGDVLYTSVLTGKGSGEAQVRDTLQSARAVVESGGFAWADVGPVYVWYRDDAQRETVDKIWAEAFPVKAERPARHCIVKPDLPDNHPIGIEIQAAR